MHIEIWSDVVCPFCYLGKRRLEKALAGFSRQEEVTITWKSFQLDPGLHTEGRKSVNEYLAAIKGWPVDQARQMNAEIARMGAEEGLVYDFDRAVVANTRDAHRLLQLAKTLGKGGEMEELLFQAYFTRGLDIADKQVLADLALEAGIERETVAGMLQTDRFDDAVEKDIYEARQIGVRGVPYFVFNDHYAVSGAQPVETFEKVLEASLLVDKR